MLIPNETRGLWLFFLSFYANRVSITVICQQKSGCRRTSGNYHQFSLLLICFVSHFRFGIMFARLEEKFFCAFLWIKFIDAFFGSLFIFRRWNNEFNCKLWSFFSPFIRFAPTRRLHSSDIVHRALNDILLHISLSFFVSGDFLFAFRTLFLRSNRSGGFLFDQIHIDRVHFVNE